MAKKKSTARAAKRSTAKAKMGNMTGTDMGSSSSAKAKAPFQYRGRTVQVMPPSDHDVEMAGHGNAAQGMLHIDGRAVMYEQTDEGIYSHEMMYQRFSTPEELAEELVRQWGTHIPAPPPMSMKLAVPGTKPSASARKPSPRSPRSRRK